MTPLLKNIVAQLKSLTPEQLTLVSAYIATLKPLALRERIAVLNSTRGGFLCDDGDGFENPINEGCDRS